MFRFLFLAVLVLLPSSAYAETPAEEYQRVQDRIRAEKKRLSEAREKESTVLGELEEVNKKLVTVGAELRQVRRKLARTEREIAETGAKIRKTEDGLERQRNWLRRKLRVMQRSGYSGDVVIALLNTEDVAQLTRVWKYLESMTLQEQKILRSYRENLAMLALQQKTLAALREELKSDAEVVKGKENELSSRKGSKEQILSSVRNAKAEHQKMLSELRQASNRLLELIREAEKTDTFAATGFAKLKGRLSWPVAGAVVIPYGSQRDAQFDTPVFRNGMHIQTDQDAGVHAVSGGKVIFAEWFKGFGQLVIVNHGSGYHTLYGNLSEIFSRVGDIIKVRQMIGKVGMSGIFNNPGLYFEIRYKGKPLDPSQWLTRKR